MLTLEQEIIQNCVTVLVPPHKSNPIGLEFKRWLEDWTSDPNELEIAKAYVGVLYLNDPNQRNIFQAQALQFSSRERLTQIVSAVNLKINEFIAQHQTAIAPVSAAPVVSSPIGELSTNPPASVVGRSPEGKEIADLINRAIGDDSIRFDLVDVVPGVRVTQYLVRQDLSQKDKNGRPCRPVPPEVIEKLARTLKVHGRMVEAPIIFDGEDGCFVVQAPRKDWKPVAIVSYLPKALKEGLTEHVELLLGVTHQGDAVKIPLSGHVSIAGITGSGKSELLTSLTFSLIRSYLPHQVRLLLIDPQRVNLSEFDDLPWLYGGKVLSTADEIEIAINHVFLEKERREELLLTNRQKNWLNYNRCITQKIRQGTASPADLLPAIAIVVDETHQVKALFGEDGGLFVSSITTIAQAFRKYGIHLILCTQRPSKEVGSPFHPQLAANLTDSIALRCKDEANSAIALAGHKFAANLGGKGDALLLSQDSSVPVRFQGFLVGQDEVQAWCDRYRHYRWDAGSSKLSKIGGDYPEDLSALRPTSVDLFPLSPSASLDCSGVSVENSPDLSLHEKRLLEYLTTVNSPTINGALDAVYYEEKGKKGNYYNLKSKLKALCEGIGQDFKSVFGVD
jgi:hypothetical protein